MADHPAPTDVMAEIDRLDELADAAELMDDEHGAARFRTIAARRRLDLMAHWDDGGS